MDNTKGNHNIVLGVIFAVILATLNFFFAPVCVFGQGLAQPSDAQWTLDPLHRKQYMREQWLARKAQRQQLAQQVSGQTTPSQKPAVKCHPSCEELLAKAKQQGTIVVVVGLFVPDLPRHALPEASEEEEARINRTRREMIAPVQDRVVARLMAAHKIKDKDIKKHEGLPNISVKADVEILQSILADPDVVRVSEQMLGRIALPQSVPIIGADQAWNSGFTGNGYTIAVLDTGVDRAHAFLSGKVAAEACFSGGEQGLTTLCPNGATSQTGRGAARPCGLSGCEHGTHVAGIAAGTNASFSGIAKDTNVIAVQVFSRMDDPVQCALSGETAPCIRFSFTDVTNALQYVYGLRNTRRVSAVVLSLQSGLFAQQCDWAEDPGIQSVKTAIENLRAAKIATSVASGNNGATDALSAPACLSSAVSAGATTKSDTVADYSNSAAFLSLLAPGGDGSAPSNSAQCIEGLGGICSSTPGNAFAYLSGTSMAAPHVAGAFAIIKQQSPTASVDDGLSILRSNGVLITDPKNNLVKPRIRLSGLSWLARYDGVGEDDEVFAIATDAASNTYVTGISCGPNCDTTDYATVKYGPTGIRLWARRYQTNGYESYPQRNVLALDSSGSVYVTAGDCAVAGCSHPRWAVIKYNTNGNRQWIARYDAGSPGYSGYISSDLPNAIKTDSASNVYVAGSNCRSAYDCAIVVIKYSANGSQLWVARYENGNSNDALALDVDGSGNVYVAGFSCATLTCQDSSSFADMDPIALKYDAQGRLLWEARYADQSWGEARSIAVDSFGNVYIVGWYVSTIDPGSEARDLLVKYDLNGAQAWYGSQRLGWNNLVRLDATGNVHAAGRSVDAVQEYPFSLRKYDANGNLIWESILPNFPHGEVKDLSIDNQGNSYTIGSVYQSFSDGSQPSGAYCISAKFDANGVVRWQGNYLAGDYAYDPCPAAALDNSNGMHVAATNTFRRADSSYHLDYVAIKYAP
jgi:subtilisin family serine protease